MFKQFMFRCKTPTGQIQISSLTEDNTLSELKAIVFSLTNIPVDDLKVSYGYPPKELDLTKDDLKLDKVFKSLKETLFITSLNSLKNDSNSPTSGFKDSNSSNQNSDDKYSSPIQELEKLTNSISNDQSFSCKQFDASTGAMKRKIVPANNSCLFTAVYYCISNGKFNPGIGIDLRKVIVDKVKEDPVLFNTAILGCPNEEYRMKISQNDTWGGSIELSILSEYYGIEIVAVDTQNVRCNRFGEDKNYDRRVFLIYNGIHYDALYFELYRNPNVRITIFPTESIELFDMALSLAKEAKDKGEFTDVKNFKLKCMNCEETFEKPELADEHAKKTGHINFGEY